MWKLILFDFDDTLYIKRFYEFIPGIEDLLFKIKKKNISIGIITYNRNAKQIIETNNLEHFFDFVISVPNKTHKKSLYIEEFMNNNPIYNPYEILFFDNDPFNIYDVGSLNIPSFLVNPVNGLSENIFMKIIEYDFHSLLHYILSKINVVYNYVERTVLVQNLSQIRELIP